MKVAASPRIKSGVRSEGTAPDPSTQFSLFRLYMIEHPTFHSAQDDEMRRGVLIALRAVVISSVALDLSCRTVSMQLRYFNHRLLLIPSH